MQPINVRYSDTQKLQVKDLVDALGVNESDLVRAALYIGIKEIKVLSAQDKNRGLEFVALNAIKAKQ